jgi:hypothetical protein
MPPRPPAEPQPMSRKDEFGAFSGLNRYESACNARRRSWRPVNTRNGAGKGRPALPLSAKDAGFSALVTRRHG